MAEHGRGLARFASAALPTKPPLGCPLIHRCPTPHPRFLLQTRLPCTPPYLRFPSMTSSTPSLPRCRLCQPMSDGIPCAPRGLLSWRSLQVWGYQQEGRPFRRCFVDRLTWPRIHIWRMFPPVGGPTASMWSSLAHLAQPLLRTRCTRATRGRRPEFLPSLWPCRPWVQRRRLWRQLRCHQVHSRSICSRSFALPSRSRSWSNLHVSVFLGGVVRLKAHPHSHVVAGG